MEQQSYTVYLQQRKQRLYAPHHVQLLKILEDHGILIEYQCRLGYCGACRIPLITGKICYCFSPLAALKKGEILTCCSIAQSDLLLDL